MKQYEFYKILTSFIFINRSSIHCILLTSICPNAFRHSLKFRNSLTSNSLSLLVRFLLEKIHVEWES